MKVRGLKLVLIRALVRVSMIALVTLVMIALATATVLADSKPDDATQARLRFNQCVDGAPPVDVYVNGQIPVNGGIAQSKVGTGTTGYLYLTPGIYHVALVPTGQALDHAFLGPLDVQIAAGHRYTVVALGQQDDPAHKALVIDETAAYQAISGNPPDSLHTAHITVNNIKGAAPITISLDGKPAENGVAYGDFKAALWPSFSHSLDFALTGPPLTSFLHLAGGDNLNPPGADNMDCTFGTYPNSDSHTSANTSVLNAVAFLQSYSQLAASTNGQTPKFDTFLAALQKTGLTQMLKTGGPYLLFAPTDAAFTALPQDKLAALLADPHALAETLRSHVVEGYYPEGTLFPNGATDRKVTNILGAPFVMTRSGSGLDGLTINGQPVSAGDTVYVANGTRLIEINSLILPASQAATPVAGAPATEPPAPISTATPQPPAPGASMPITGGGQSRATPALLLIIVAALASLLAGDRLRHRAAG